MKGIIVVPDFVANAGGVISSYVEYIEGNKSSAFKIIEEKVSINTKFTLEEARNRQCLPRECALEIAKKRVRKKCKICKF